MQQQLLEKSELALQAALAEPLQYDQRGSRSNKGTEMEILQG